jgi:2-hydroxychromene-2-carboxylate isomerase
VQLTAYFEFGSPYTYLAYCRIMQHRERYPADMQWVPFSLWHVVQQEGGKLNRELPNMARYNFHDLRRFAKAYDVKFWVPQSFPASTLDAHRAHFIAAEQGKAEAWREAVFAAHWQDNADIGNTAVLARLAKQAGIKGIQERLKDEPVKEALRASTEAAYVAGACGSPFFVLTADGKTETYWGNDRLDWVEARLAGLPAPAHWTGGRVHVKESI